VVGHELVRDLFGDFERRGRVTGAAPLITGTVNTGRPVASGRSQPSATLSKERRPNVPQALL